MIAALPERVLTLLVTSRPSVPVRATIAATSSDGTMRDFIARAIARGRSNEEILDALDRRIRRYLATVGHRGEGERNATAFRVARWLVNDFGMSGSTGWAYLVEWNAGNTPPLTERELSLVMRSAKRSGSRLAGCAHTERGSAA